MKKRTLLIGPYPPPDNGTSLPFKSFVDYVRRNCDVETHLVNIQSGSMPLGAPLYSLKTIAPFFRISFQVLKEARNCKKILINGSLRYITTIGALHTLLLSLCPNRVVGIYIAGGTFHTYYSSLSSPQRFFVRLCLKRAKALVVQTKLAYDGLVQDFDNLFIVPNWTEISHLAIQATETGSKSLASNADTPVRFVFIGDITPEKGILELIQAFISAQTTLALKNRSINLDIYGPIPDKYHNTITPLLFRSQNDTLVYHGYEKHNVLTKKLSQYDILVLPTRYSNEGHPGVIVEAMTLGLPVIASRLGGISEVVAHNINGILCESGNVSSLSEAMVLLSMDSALRHKMGQAAKETAKRFDVSVVLPELCRVYGLELH
jgi:glycosyltransferase involved in cell wall biosynthesis